MRSIDVACPSCSAPAGSPCVGPFGRAVVGYHASRTTDATVATMGGGHPQVQPHRGKWRP